MNQIIIKTVISLLQTTLGSVPSADADAIVRDCIKLLGLIESK